MGFSLEIVCFLFFLLGDLARVFVYRLTFFTSPSYRWWAVFYLGADLVSSLYFLWGGLPNLTCFRMVGLIVFVRFTGTPWLIRLSHYITKTMHTFWYSIPCLVSTVAALFAAIYLYATLLTFTLGIEIARSSQNGSLALEKEVTVYFGSFTRTLLSLCQILTGGLEWSEVIDALWRISPALGYMLLGYVAIMFVGVLNLVTALFVEQSMDSSAALARTQMLLEAKYVKQLQAVFLETNTSSSGTLSWETFQRQMGDERIRAYLASLELDLSELRSVFSIMDHGGKGSLTIDEFVWGCMRLKGTAKSVDLCTLLFEHRQSRRLLEAFTERLTQTVHEIDRKLESQRTAEPKLWASQRSCGGASSVRDLETETPSRDELELPNTVS